MSSEIINAMDDYVNKIIMVKLRNKKIIQGKLMALDQHMNLILANCEDITNDDAQNLDKIILRGDNIVMVSLNDKPDLLKLKDNA
tara:strand:- start:35 stop:289 length:255 start_codon:yes stop_codon:yes gene_type:complete